MSIPASPSREVCPEAAPQVDMTPFMEYCLPPQWVSWASRLPPPAALGVPIGAGKRSPAEFQGSRWPNPKGEFSSFYGESVPEMSFILNERREPLRSLYQAARWVNRTALLPCRVYAMSPGVGGYQKARRYFSAGVSKLDAFSGQTWPEEALLFVTRPGLDPCHRGV